MERRTFMAMIAGGLERRYADLRKEAALAVAEELVRLRVEVIVVSSTLTVLAAKQATTTVPIVVTVPADPVATGLVTSLARPGRNVTGLSFVGTELAGKQVDLLKEAVRRPRPGPLSGLSEGQRMDPGPAPAAHSSWLVSWHRMSRRLPPPGCAGRPERPPAAIPG
jgi:hypothetical protein